MHQALQIAIMHPDKSQVIPLMPEEIKKTSEEEDMPETWDQYAEYQWEDWGSDKANIAFFQAQSGEPCGMESYHAKISSIFITTKKSNITKEDITTIPNDYGIPVATIESNEGPLFIFTDYLTYYKVILFINGNLIVVQELEIPYYDCPC